MRVIGLGPHTPGLTGLALVMKAVASMGVIGMVLTAASITTINGTRNMSVIMGGTTNTKITTTATGTITTTTDTDASDLPSVL
jgi:hypothetical protein